MCTFVTWKKNRVFLVVLLLVFGSAAMVVPLGFRCSYLVQYLIQYATYTRKQHRQQDEAKAAANVEKCFPQFFEIVCL